MEKAFVMAFCVSTFSALIIQFMVWSENKKAIKTNANKIELKYL